MICNHGVAGSSPAAGTIEKRAIPERMALLFLYISSRLMHAAYFAGTVASGVGVTPSGVVCIVDPCGLLLLMPESPLCDEREECDFLCFF